MADDLRVWFPLYVADMLNSRKVRKMDAEYFGIFMFLLIEQWAGGPLPDDREDLIEMGRSSWENVQNILQAQFVLTDKGWVNERLVEIWEEQDAKKRRASRAGKAGAEARWGKKLSIVKDEEPVLPTEEPSDRIPLDNADAMRSLSDPNGNESRGEESKAEESISDPPTEKPTKKRGDAKPDVIRIRNGLRWGEIQHPAKRGYKEITREYFEDVIYVTKSDDEFPVDLVIENQEELDEWLSATT